LKQKRVFWLIIVLVMLAFVGLCMTKAANVGLQPPELEIERQDSDNLSARATSASTLPVNASEANVTIADIAQEQLRASNQLDFTTDSENITTMKVCISQWLQDILALQETLHCIGDNIKSTKG